MIWLFCHVFVGMAYRAELALKWRSDVCTLGSVTNLHLYARDFDTGLFDCLEGEHVLRRNCYACCCTPVLFGVDAAASGFMTFWLALILTSLFLPLIWIFGFISRFHIRKQFEMQRHILRDICAWFWCIPCALIQEHRFMERTFDALRRDMVGAEITPLVPTATIAPPEATASQTAPTPGKTAGKAEISSNTPEVDRNQASSPSV